MSEVVYLNGYLVSRDQARISPLDYGFLYGFGLFETMRAYSGRIFKLKNHLDRLEYAANNIGLQIDVPELQEATQDTLHANQLQDARIRITVSAGEGETVPDPATCSNPTVMITAVHYSPYPEQVYDRGFRTCISSIRRNSGSPLAGLKSTNYLESLLARREARSSGFDEAILLNEKGLLAEASTSNIFIVSGGKLLTPGKQNGLLPGITRDIVLEMAVQLGIDMAEQDIELDELVHAEEVFLTNSLIEVMPVNGVDMKPVGNGKPGPVTRRIVEVYRSLVILGK
ncbi:MAG: aminotransferase class IV [Dehalococcoidia bacterium]